MQMLQAECPVCAGLITAHDVLVGEIIPCRDCGAELEVSTIEPFTLELAPTVQEDWGE